ncbi:MAG: Bro-N domain-containing protein [Candidatus Symbiothrix sp.]|jgi:prophage antirepressor-like protein|nr:Bro-N domain-containing protein [Candidatus Symbiothrix sp.]
METNKNELKKVFTFIPSNHPIRIEVINNEPWFVAKDVCDALSISNNRDAVDRLDSDEKLMSAVPTLGVNRGLWLVNESGLYNLIFQSRKPEARAFRKWVTSEILPAIRKYGVYATDKVLSNPETLLEALQALNCERKKSNDLNVIIKGLKTQNKMLNSSNSTMIAKIEKQRKLLENKEINSNAKIAERFFMVVDMLVAVKTIRGKQTFTTKYQINNRNFGRSREFPESKIFQPVWISYLMEDYGISGEWIMTGKGRMFEKDVKVCITN